MRVLSLNVRKRNRKSATKLLQMVDDKYQQCVVALQEAQRWTTGVAKMGTFFGNENSDCRIFVPHKLATAVEDAEEDHPEFVAVKLGDVAIFSIHLPCQTAVHNNEMLVKTFNTISKLLDSWCGSGPRPARHCIMAGDFNVSLPPGVAEATGMAIYPRARASKHQERTRAVMEFLAQNQLRALNTFGIHGSEGSELAKTSWTWRGKAHGKRVRTQIDYLCVTPGLTGTAEVVPHWRYRTDHRPIFGELIAASGDHAPVQALAHINFRGLSLKGWTPDSPADLVAYQTACLHALASQADGSTHLGLLEQTMVAECQKVDFTTANQRWRLQQMPGHEECTLKRAAACAPGHSRRAVIAQYRKVRGARIRERVHAAMTSAAAAAQRAAKRPAAFLVAGAPTVSRRRWQEGALQYCTAKYHDESNTRSAQVARVQTARSVADAATLDGRARKPVRVSEAFQALSRVKSGKAGGADEVVPELLKALPWALRVQVSRWFALRHRGAIEDVPSWTRLALTAAPKEGGTVGFDKVRWLACTPVTQKWYLRCPVARMQAKLATRKGAAAQCYGFTPGYSVASVVELVRQALVCSEMWGCSLVVCSGDVRAAFDELSHERLATALMHLPLDPDDIACILQEMVGMQASAIVGDAPPTEYFDVTRGTRTGGVEGPLLLNALLAYHFDPLITSWQQRSFGFIFDDEPPITHAFWADNLIFLAKSDIEANTMLQEATDTLHAAGLRWKHSSLELLWGESFGDAQLPPVIVSANRLSTGSGEPDYRWTTTDRLKLLGAVLDRRGRTQVSLDHRLMAADRIFYSHRKYWASRHAADRDKANLLMKGAEASLLFGAGGLHWTRESLIHIRRWEAMHLRKVWRLRRRAQETARQHMKRTDKIIKAKLREYSLERIHIRALRQLHRWAGTAVRLALPTGAPSVLARLFEYRRRHLWKECEDGNRRLDPANASGWRHRRGGRQVTPFEDLLVAVHGIDWLRDAQQPVPWKRAEQEFVDKALVFLQMGKAAAGSPQSQSQHMLREAQRDSHAAAVEPPAHEIHRQLLARTWSLPDSGLHFVVDSAVVADWVAGKSEVDDTQYQPAVSTIIDSLSIMAGPGGPRSLRAPCAEPVEWFRRGWNRAADQLAKWSMTRRTDYTFERPDIEARLNSNIRFFSDGARMSVAHRAAFAWLAVAYTDDLGPVLLAARAAWCDEVERTHMKATVINMELTALSDAVHWIHRHIRHSCPIQSGDGRQIRVLNHSQCEELLRLATESWPAILAASGSCRFPGL